MERDVKKFNDIVFDVISDFQDNKCFNNEKVCYLKKYMLEFPNCMEIGFFKKWIDNLIYNNLFNEEFIKNLYSDDTFYFYKLLELFVNRPFADQRFYTNNFSFISKLLEYPIDLCGCYRTQVEGCMNYFKRINRAEVTDDYVRRVDKFMEDDLSLIRGGKDVYTNSLKEEYAKYLKYLKYDFNYFSNSEEFKTFTCYYYNMDFNDLQYMFLNKLLGNVGEYYFFRKYRFEKLLRFVARDIGNGAGYDIYFRRDNIERLIEVKTTAYYNQNDRNDNFCISKNEYDMMLRIFEGNFNAKYFISRVFYHEGVGCCDLDLQYIGNDILRCQSIPNIEYEITSDKNNKIYALRKK